LRTSSQCRGVHGLPEHGPADPDREEREEIHRTLYAAVRAGTGQGPAIAALLGVLSRPAA
jgi:hypothetical protein